MKTRRKPRWRCGMCYAVNPPRNRARCHRCGAVKGMGSHKGVK